LGRKNVGEPCFRDGDDLMTPFRSDSTDIASELNLIHLGHVPRHQRDKVLSGFRWTVWLSALAVPFSAGTNLLLARVGPETIGVYGLLAVYIGLIASFLYFGGDPVVIRFIPECREEDRASFLASYLLIIFCALFGWLVIAGFFPAALHFVLGGDGGDRFRFLVVCFAPLPVAYWMILASLKGLLDIRFSQILGKLLPISAFLAYAGLYLLDRPLMVRSPFGVVWTIYFLPMLIFGLVGAIRLLKLCSPSKLRFFLPQGFWSYAFGTQQAGTVLFLAYRLDYILVLNHGGLGVLGLYVAVMTIAGLIGIVDAFFMDTLLPSLTNMIAARNPDGAKQILAMHMRILFLVATCMSCGIMVFGAEATSLMGEKYGSVRELLIVMAMVQGIANPGAFGGTVLASIGRQRLSTWSALLHMVIFSGLFFALWPRLGLPGAVIAYATALTASWVSMMVIAQRVAPHFGSINALWLKAALTDVLVCCISIYYIPLGVFTGFVVWICMVALFLLIAQYSVSECKMMAQTLMPSFLWKVTRRLGSAIKGSFAPG
jgi:O-antigen/teichoic acid export membrane protein